MASLIIAFILVASAFGANSGNKEIRQLSRAILRNMPKLGKAPKRTVFRGGGGRFKSTTCI